MDIKQLLEIPHESNNEISEKIRLGFLSFFKGEKSLSPAECFLLYLDVKDLEERYSSQILQFKIQLRDSEYSKTNRMLVAKYKEKYGEL